jgi:CRISPR-associated protein Csb2
VTLLGDSERRVQIAERSLAELEDGPRDKAGTSRIRKARKSLDAEMAKLNASLKPGAPMPDRPSAEDLKRAVELMPDRRNRQMRTFPCVVPGRPYFVFIWRHANPDGHAAAIKRICARVTRIGHSSSFVRCAVIDRDVSPTLVPATTGTHTLRVVGPGQVERLEHAYARHRAVEPRVLPASPQPYHRPSNLASALPCSVFSEDWIVFERVGGDRPLASRGPDLASALRRALIEADGNASLPEEFSGHDANGAPASRPHLAFVPLPWVGHQHADGSVQGLALVLPRSIGEAGRERLLRLVAKWELRCGDPDDGYAIVLGTSAEAGRAIRVRFRRTESSRKATLDAHRWCRPSKRFVSAVPIALDRHPGNLRSNVDRTAQKAMAEAEKLVADGCARLGLPLPSSTAISFAPLLPGAQHVRDFTPWPPRPGRTRRARVHAEICFTEPVRGPLIVGAGRFSGFGLCLPVGP